MSLFERINKKITEEKKNQRDNSYLFDDNKDSSKNKKKPNQNKKYKDLNQNKKPTEKELANQRRNPELNRQQRISRMYDAYDDGDLGNPDYSKGYEDKTKTKTKTTKTFFDAEKAKAKREKLKQGRKAYIDPKTGKASKEGIVRYISKARDMKSGGNTNTRANRKAAEIISKSAGPEYAKKIEDKYGGNVSRTRRKDAKSLEQIKKDIDVKNPVKPGQFTGKPVPASTPVKKIKTAVTDKEIQDVLKTGRKTKPGKTKKITVGSLDARDKAIKDLDDLIIEPKKSDVKQTEKLIKKQRRIVTKKITTPKPNEVSQSEKILDKVKDEIKKKKTKTPPKFAKPSTTGLYDPLKNKIPDITKLKPLRVPKLAPSALKTTAKTGTQFQRMMKHLGKNRNPYLKTAAGLALLTVGTYGALKNRKASKNRMIPPIGGSKPKEIYKPFTPKLYLQGDDK